MRSPVIHCDDCVIAGQHVSLGPENHLPRQGFTLESHQLDLVHETNYSHRIRSQKR